MQFAPAPGRRGDAASVSVVPVLTSARRRTFFTPSGRDRQEPRRAEEALPAAAVRAVVEVDEFLLLAPLDADASQGLVGGWMLRASDGRDRAMLLVPDRVNLEPVAGLQNE